MIDVCLDHGGAVQAEHASASVRPPGLACAYARPGDDNSHQQGLKHTDLNALESAQRNETEPADSKRDLPVSPILACAQ